MAKPEFTRVYGKKLSDTPKAIKFRVDGFLSEISNEEYPMDESSTEWFPISQISEVTDTEMVVKTWVLEKKELM